MLQSTPPNLQSRDAVAKPMSAQFWRGHCGRPGARARPPPLRQITVNQRARDAGHRATIALRFLPDIGGDAVH
jgi:hypothetical protein